MSMDELESPAPRPVSEEDANGNTPPGPQKRDRKRQAPTEKPPRKRRKKGTGTRGGWSKGLKIGPRPAIDPGAEFNELYKKATNAFIDDSNTEKALELILEAIAINPEIYSAHALLSEIYFSRDEDEKAIAALFSGAHSIPTNPEVWQQAANACLQRSKANRETALQQASYCYARIIHSDRKNLDARFQRAGVNRELGNYSKAMKDLETILEQMPRNSGVLRQIAEICIETRDLERAKSLYEETLKYYRDNGFEGEESFTWADILVYAQILALEEPPDLALSNSLRVLKQLSRWLLGREDEDFWDQYSDDDREWDSEDDPRRTLVPQFVASRHPPDAYGPGLPLELRARLGILRLKQGQEAFDEAFAHFEWLEPEARDEEANVYEYFDLFLEVAQALHEVKEHNQALRYYEALKDTNAYSDTEFWLGVAANSYLCDKKVQAIECYEAAKAGDDTCVEARTQLSKLYTDFGDKEKAMENAREAIRIAEGIVYRTDRRKYERKEQRLAREEAEMALKQARQLPGPAGSGTPIERLEGPYQSKRSRARRRPRPRQQQDGDLMGEYELEQEDGADVEEEGEAEEQQDARRIPKPRSRAKPMTPEERELRRTETINRLHMNLVNSTEAMRKGDAIARNTWMDCAESLVTDFRRNRAFFPADRSQGFAGFSRDARNVNSRKKWEQQQEIHRDEDQAVDQDFPIPSVEASVPTEYHDISFSDWLDVFLEYALVLANTPEDDARQRCYTVINAALDCAVWYQDAQATFQIYVTYLACALALRDGTTLFNVVLRWFMRNFQFCTDAYRLFAAMNLFFPHAQEASSNGRGKQVPNTLPTFRNTQKFLFRKVVAFDVNLPADYAPAEFGPVPDFMRQGHDQLRKEDGEDATLFKGADGQIVTPKEMDVVLLTLYAHLLYASGSFPSALSYLFRARSLDPDNPVVLLSIALSYMHEMLKRQADNRHMYLMQGWAFFEEYADARRKWAAAARAKMGMDETWKGASVSALVESEIEFNRARCWHMLGMSDLAVRSYQKMLSLSHPQPSTPSADDSTTKNAPPEYTMEAAYAIQTMYALSGNAEMAREVTERYLVV